MDAVRGRAIRMGWHRYKTRPDQFEVVILLTDAPAWPLSVVWKAWPIELTVIEPPVPSPNREQE